MKLFPIALVSLAIGAGVGAALAYVEVGEVETALAPPPRPGEAELAGVDMPFSAGPDVSVDQATFDFGTMQRGATESHEFIVTNKGTAPLTLEVGSTTCKCTLGEVADKPLAPGESTPVRLEWVAKSQPGMFRQVAKVNTNDPRTPSLELTVEGVIVEMAGLVPEEFLLGKVAADEVGTASVYLASYDTGEDAQPLLAEVILDESIAMADRYHFEVEPAEPDEMPIERAASGVKITVKAGPGLPIGYLTEWVKVKTNLHDNKPVGDATDGEVLQVPLLAIVEGDISIRGSSRWSKGTGVLNLGKIQGAKGREEKLIISYKGEHAEECRAELESADPEWLEVELGEPKKIRDGVVHQPMTVRVPPGRPSVVRSGAGAESGGIGDGDARIRLTTNHPTTSELDVKVRFVIAE